MIRLGWLPDWTGRVCIDTPDKLALLRQHVDAAIASGQYALDTETTGLDVLSGARMFMFSFSYATQAGGQGRWVPGHPESDKMLVTSVACFVGKRHKAGGQTNEQEVLAELARLTTSDAKGFMFNAKFDVKMLWADGVPLTNLLSDASLALYALDPSFGDALAEVVAARKAGKLRPTEPMPRTLKDSCALLLDWPADERDEVKAWLEHKFGKDRKKWKYEFIPKDLVATYACGDTERTLMLGLYCENELAAREQTQVARMETELTLVVAEMELNGVRVDEVAAKKARAEMAELGQKAHDTMLELTGLANCNFNSDDTLVKYAWPALNRHPEATGQHAVPDAWDMDALAPFATKKRGSRNVELVPNSGAHGLFCKALLDWRGSEKAIGTYLDPWLLTWAKPDEETGEVRIHAELRQDGTDTGRFSCVHASTKLETNCGTFSIGHLPLTKHANMRILTHTGEWQRIVRCFSKGKDRMYAVTTSSGRQIICTRRHRFLTPNGWQALAALEVGERLYTRDMQVEFRHSCSNGAKLRTAHVHRTVDAQCSERKVWGEWPPVAPKPEVLASQVCYANERGAQQEPCSRYVGKQAREPGSALHPFGQNKANRTMRVEYGHVADVLQVGCKRVSRAQEHAVLRVAGQRWVSARYEHSGPGTYRRLERLAARFERSVFERQERTFGLPRQTLPVFAKIAPSAMAGIRTAPSVQALLRNRKGPAQPHRVFFKQSRGARGNYAAGRGTPACATGAFVEEMDCGLFDNGQASVGSGWELARQSKGQNSGQAENTKPVSCRVQGSSCGNQAAREQVASAFATDKEDVIVSILPCGIHEVWDIEVETDHSYVAHGFINHNSGNPNMQNVPIEARMLAPSKGCALVLIDYSQLEFRVFAHYAGGDVLDAYKKDKDVDFHQAVADMLGIPRKPAKNINFGMLYGMGREKLIFSLCGLSEEKVTKEWREAQELLRNAAYRKDVKAIAQAEALRDSIAPRYKKVCDAAALYDLYQKKFPRAKQLYYECADRCKKRGWIRNLVGRRRYLPAEFAHVALNTLIQGGAADVVKRAMLRVAKALLEFNEQHPDANARMLLQIHDELVFEVLQKYAKPLADTMAPIMADEPLLSVPLVAEADVVLDGEIWMNKHEFAEAKT